MFIATLVWTVTSFYSQHSCFTNPKTFLGFRVFSSTNLPQNLFPPPQPIRFHIHSHSFEKNAVKDTSCPPVSSKLLLAHSFVRCQDLIVGNYMQLPRVQGFPSRTFSRFGLKEEGWRGCYIGIVSLKIKDSWINSLSSSLESAREGS